MRIIEQSHEIISLPNNLLELIEQCARTCYKSEDKIGCTRPASDSEDIDFCSGITVCNDTECHYHSSGKFVKMLRDRKHDAMLEFGDCIVKLVTNRGVLAELTRHRIGVSFAVESTRYVRYDNEMEFIRPCWWDGSTRAQQNLWELAMKNAEASYLNLLDGGWRPEMAREVLPHSLKTEICMKANIREFRHIFQLRCSKKAHPQIKALFLPLLSELKTKVPVVFDDIYPEEI